MAEPKISVIIVSWNVEDSLKKCLDSIRATKYTDLEVIVIDNASKDGSEKLATIKNITNIGFPKAVNIGLKNASGDLLVVLNPDTIVPKNFFEKINKFFADYPDAWIMGPKLTNSDGTVQGSIFPKATIINTFREFWLGEKNLNSKFVPKTDKPVEVENISGSCMIFPKSTQDKVGLLTDKVFMYFEDLDYCRRIKRLGGKIYFNPEIIITHNHGESSRQTLRADPTRLPFWKGYLWDSSLWYHGPIKHYLMTLISWSGQKLHKLFKS